jgi:hypothetical protein
MDFLAWGLSQSWRGACLSPGVGLASVGRDETLRTTDLDSSLPPADRRGLVGKLVMRESGDKTAMTSIVVKRGQYDEYDQLYRAFGSRVPVLWDRRRPAKASAQDGQRQIPNERRNTSPTSWQALGFVVTRDSAR